MRQKYFVEVGQRYGRWLVVGGPLGAPLCRCDCGTEKNVNRSNLARGLTKSCGCLARELLSESKKGNKYGYKHGHTPSGKPQSPEYGAWAKAKDRCFNPNCPEFFRYGGRGISMCSEWRESFAAFLAEVGERPSSVHSIDRINNDRGYEPGNVRWATKGEQSANRRPYNKR